MKFLGPDGKDVSYNDARVVVLPIPYEATTSYGKGTKNGPAKILEASAFVETYDEELDSSPDQVGIFTEKPIEFGNATGESAIDLIEKATAKIVGAGKFPFGLGGEHSVTTGLVKAVHKKFPNLHVVHFDAHADMRPEYGGTIWSHASVMRRIHEMGIPHTSIGIRAVCEEEMEVIRPIRKNYFFAHEVAHDPNWIRKALDTITGPVFLTFDIDAFDCSLIPATGTPMPGGISWYQATDFMKQLTKYHKVVGADLVELAPSEYHPHCDFTAARLVYKMIGYCLVPLP